MSPKYELFYFSLNGRGEPIRWIFTYAGQQFEDTRIDLATEWSARKSQTPYGKLPVLCVDGKPLSDSVAICRYLGQVLKLAPEDPWVNAVGEEIAASVNDLLPTAVKAVFAKKGNNTEEAEKFTKELRGMLPFTLKAIEDRLKNGNDFICGNKVTWFDLFVVPYLSFLREQHSDVLDGYPSVQKLVNKVLSLPSIDNWVKKRPDALL